MTAHDLGEEQLAALEAKLDSAPPFRPKRMTKRAVVIRLRPRLLALRGKGYPVAALAALLEEHGFSIQPAVLRKYLRAAGKASRSRTRSAAPKGAGGARGASKAAPSADAPKSGLGTPGAPRAGLPPEPQETQAAPGDRNPGESAPRRAAAPASRSMFVPRKDTHDL